MKKITYIYIFVPLILFASFLVVLIFNNEIIGYLPTNILSIYPLFPCWPGNDGFDIGGPPQGGRDVHLFNDFTSYHVGQSINPTIVYTNENFGIGTPNLYLYHGNLTQMRMVQAYFQDKTQNPDIDLNNLLIWHKQSYTLKKGPRCVIPAQYSLDEISRPPQLNSTGWYVFHVDFGYPDNNHGASYGFYVTNP